MFPNCKVILYICAMIIRKAIHEISELMEDFPVVAIVGPRQVGKSTLAKAIESNREKIYIDLENPSDRVRLEDPVLFLKLTATSWSSWMRFSLCPIYFRLFEVWPINILKTGGFSFWGRPRPNCLSKVPKH